MSAAFLKSQSLRKSSLVEIKKAAAAVLHLKLSFFVSGRSAKPDPKEIKIFPKKKSEESKTFTCNSRDFSTKPILNLLTAVV